MKNIGVFKNAGNQGYILMPRRLLNLLFAEHDDLDLFKLYAYLLLKATFVVTDNIDLSHGELYYSLRTLSKKMGVTRYTVSRMLHELEDYELIKIIPSKTRGKSSRIKMLYYDQMCDFSTVYDEPTQRTKRDFDFFWDLYHEMSGLEPIDKEMALRYWKRLNGDERMMAVASISVYLDSKPRSRWRTAVEYLGYKSFLPDLN